MIILVQDDSAWQDTTWSAFQDNFWKQWQRIMDAYQFTDNLHYVLGILNVSNSRFQIKLMSYICSYISREWKNWTHFTDQNTFCFRHIPWKMDLFCKLNKKLGSFPFYVKSFGWVIEVSHPVFRSNVIRNGGGCAIRATNIIQGIPLCWSTIQRLLTRSVKLNFLKQYHFLRN